MLLFSLAFLAFASCTPTRVSIGDHELDVESLPITEMGVKFEQTVVTDITESLQSIVVPQHRNISGMTVMNDFKYNITIYKVEQERRCYVIDMDPLQKESFKDLNEGVHTLKKYVPSWRAYKKNQQNMFAGGAVDPTTIAGMRAASLCGPFDIVQGVASNEKDVNKFAIDRLKKSASSGLYDVQLRDIFTCNDAKMKEALAELKRCQGDMNDFQATCKFRRSSCVYIVTCSYDSVMHYWNCQGKHNFDNIFCCEYECTRPRS